MRAAYERGFKVYTLTDCCAATRCARTTRLPYLP
jgi:nicotinamidase-related amidase